MACQLSVFQQDYRICKFLPLDVSGTGFVYDETGATDDLGARQTTCAKRVCRIAFL